MLTVTALDHLVLNVRDVEAAAAWYDRVLGMRRDEHRTHPDAAVRTSMMFGDNKINLRPIDASPDDWFTAAHPAAGSADLCFLVDSSPDQVVAHLITCSVEIETGPVVKRGARGDIVSVYCRDPDGNLVELSSYH